MLTKKQLKRFFEQTADFRPRLDVRKKVDMNNLNDSIFAFPGTEYMIREGFEAWGNDKYRFEIVNVYEDGMQLIFDADEARWIEVSKGSKFTFYKVIKRRIK